MKKTIVYILSSNFSGSTMLSLMLGANSNAMQIGEAKHLRRADKSRNGCLICGEENICEVKRGITPENIDYLYDIEFERWSDIDVIVDCSKKTWWAERFLKQRDKYDLKFIHLVRDPRSLARRWDLAYKDRSSLFTQRWKLVRKSTDMLFRAPFCDRTSLSAYKWLGQNRDISNFFEKYKLEYHLVTYHDLVKDTEKQLSEISDFIGIQYETQQATYWTTQQHAGGKTSDILHHKALQLDLRWQEYLSDSDKDKIENNTLIKKYLAQQGISMLDNGLTLNTDVEK